MPLPLRLHLRGNSHSPAAAHPAYHTNIPLQPPVQNTPEPWRTIAASLSCYQGEKTESRDIDPDFEVDPLPEDDWSSAQSISSISPSHLPRPRSSSAALLTAADSGCICCPAFCKYEVASETSPRTLRDPSTTNMPLRHTRAPGGGERVARRPADLVGAI